MTSLRTLALHVLCLTLASLCVHGDVMDGGNRRPQSKPGHVTGNDRMDEYVISAAGVGPRSNGRVVRQGMSNVARAFGDDVIIKDDVDLGRKHVRDNVKHDDVTKPKSGQIPDADINNDVDLGLKHVSDKHDDVTKPKPGQTTDADIKNDVIFGLKHVSDKHDDVTKPKSGQIPDADIQDEFIVGRLHGHPEAGERSAVHPKSESDRSRPSGVREETETDLCDSYDVDGCSIPLGAPFFFKELFTRSCYRHDVCYGCGVEYKIPRKECDQAFKDNMRRSCLSAYANGTDVILKDHKHQVAAITEALREKFQTILLDKMIPATPTPTNDNSNNKHPASVAKFASHAHTIHRDVTKHWARLLLGRILSDRNRKLSSLAVTFDPSQLTMDDDDDVRVPGDDVTPGLCRDVLAHVRDENVGDISCEEVGLLSCLFFEHVYFLAVRVFASTDYHGKPEFYCDQDFVKMCLKPLAV